MIWRFVLRSFKMMMAPIVETMIPICDNVDALACPTAGFNTAKRIITSPVPHTGDSVLSRFLRQQWQAQVSTVKDDNTEDQRTDCLSNRNWQ